MTRCWSGETKMFIAKSASKTLDSSSHHPSLYWIPIFQDFFLPNEYVSTTSTIAVGLNWMPISIKRYCEKLFIECKLRYNSNTLINNRHSIVWLVISKTIFPRHVNKFAFSLYDLLKFWNKRHSFTIFVWIVVSSNYWGKRLNGRFCYQTCMNSLIKSI